MTEPTREQLIAGINAALPLTSTAPDKLQGARQVIGQINTIASLLKEDAINFTVALQSEETLAAIENPNAEQQAQLATAVEQTDAIIVEIRDKIFKIGRRIAESTGPDGALAVLNEAVSPSGDFATAANALAKQKASTPIPGDPV